METYQQRKTFGGKCSRPPRPYWRFCKIESAPPLRRAQFSAFLAVLGIRPAESSSLPATWQTIAQFDEDFSCGQQGSTSAVEGILSVATCLQRLT
jgi:hypothetical protein